MFYLPGMDFSRPQSLVGEIIRLQKEERVYLSSKRGRTGMANAGVACGQVNLTPPGVKCSFPFPFTDKPFLSLVTTKASVCAIILENCYFISLGSHLDCSVCNLLIHFRAHLASLSAGEARRRPGIRIIISAMRVGQSASPSFLASYSTLAEQQQ